ncbi:ATP-binding protein [Sulfuricurvum sp.]|uniref:ATP-binding protein n=1 Tax=Sulfuricurvum sp. TaxID=2025608 RepID=UPI002E3330A0|nr:ATP-binding protein [Sulfuricurvum sp.]HEX5329620.1 ATP-binding protein [Sulfuricurvum sp.]
MSLNTHSITSQMVLSLIITSLFVVITGTLFLSWYSINHEKRAYLHESDLQANLVVDLVTAPLAFFDLQAIDTSMYQLQKNKNVLFAVVYAPDKTPITIYNPNHQSMPKTIFPLGIRYEHPSWNPFKLGKLINTLEIKQNNQLLGYLYIEKKTERITSFVVDLLKSVALFSVILIFIIYFISRILSKNILQPILILTEAAKEVAENSNYSLRVTHDKKDEIAYLYDAFNHLLSETESLTTHLESRVTSRTMELQNSLETLKNTQIQLVESEKMAALGNLVSGVAHEVNTPLGNAITGGSIIVRETQQLLHQMEEGTLKKTVMEQKLTILNETSHLLLNSINHAANLIRSFKRISVDQSVEDKQEFNLYEYLEEILLTFHNKLKKVPVTVILEGDRDLLIKSYPGVYAQIISNFIQNSLLHGFSGSSTEATITIRFNTEGKRLILTYSDNGVGMDEKIKKIAFEPFTTTKRNAGGTGLGLNIVYNLITQKLKGEISLRSEPQKGVEFTLTLPLEPATLNSELLS